MAEKILSCFIDESGDFGPYDFRSPYYYVVSAKQIAFSENASDSLASCALLQFFKCKFE